MRLVSVLSVPLMIVGIVIFGMIKRINVYDSFVEGARSGLENMVQIVAPLVGLMVGISMLRASGFLEILGGFLKPVTDLIGMPKEVLPLALLRPVSGSGSMAIVADIFKNFGPDSDAGRVASVMMGSTETTFYTVAVYFGAVGIKSSRHTLKAALTADFCGMIIATAAARVWLG